MNVQEIIDSVSTVLKGKEEVVLRSLVCFLSGGHLLLEDVPGVGKTTLALSLSRVLGLSFARIQFTSDLLPSDILGVSIYDQSKKAFVFKQGPIFHQIVLADEINRATPKTQSALLEEKSLSPFGSFFVPLRKRILLDTLQQIGSLAEEKDGIFEYNKKSP